MTQQRQVNAVTLPALWKNLAPLNAEIRGYEIHQGRTEVTGHFIRPCGQTPR
ncbi:MAG: hypothetical protein HC810_08620 [Acaryochloridaceae cyanobacterium RL_2_7]|nr:hypothetical protein [Acaryochloridaceae cyanobacterium RL_2_7]